MNSLIRLAPNAVSFLQNRLKASDVSGENFVYRVFVLPGCGAPRFRLALDLQHEGDTLEQLEGIPFVLDHFAKSNMKEGIEIVFDDHLNDIMVNSLDFASGKC